MFIELHIIQNFAPSNLNRSDTGSPKDCEFGGVRRARVSSQCLKRAIRRESTFQKLLEETGSGVRTRRLILEISKCLSGQEKPPETTVKIISEVFKEGGIERPEVKRGEEEEKDNTRLILFMDKQAIGEMTERFRASWETLAGKDKNAKNKLIKELGDILAKSVKSPDIALFGEWLKLKVTSLSASCSLVLMRHVRLHMPSQLIRVV
jgi:CRISPR system Cascade subunit CasC